MCVFVAHNGYVRASYRRRFQTHPDLLVQMLSLRLSGWSLRSLTDLYQVDRTTIRHWTIKYDIKPVVSEVPYRLLPEVTVDYVVAPKPKVNGFKYQHIFDEDEERINPGKSYKEYVADHKARNPKWKFIVNPYACDPSNLY